MREARNTGGRALPGGPGRGPGAMPSFEKPKDAKKAVLRLMSYLVYNKWALIGAVIMMLASTVSFLAGSYFLKPLINDYILPGNFSGLLQALAVLAVIYLLEIMPA
ncbi:MAG: hypothetical protein M1546_24740, partial [Chloroflexi bacterium]|nr:hypothetical protein [Chloroflexota bacterium]